MSVVSPILKATNERKTVNKSIKEDWDFCRFCDDDTWHVPGEYGLECEYCILSEY